MLPKSTLPISVSGMDFQVDDCSGLHKEIVSFSACSITPAMKLLQATGYKERQAM